MKLLFVNILFVLIFLSCKRDVSGGGSVDSNNENYNPTSLSAVDYLKWVESIDGLRVTKKIDKIDFLLQYTPKEYFVLKENFDSLKDFNSNRLNELSENYKKLQYFNLRISIDEFHDEIIKYKIRNDFEYEDRVKYFSFYMQNDLKLIDGNDTLPCVMFNYERTFNLTPNNNFQIAFPSSSNKSSKTLIYNDVYLGTGKIMLTISQEKLNSVPKIIF